MSMVVKDIFIYGTTKNGFSIYPKRYFKDFEFIDRDRKKSFIKHDRYNANTNYIQYQIGDVRGYTDRPGHQFGFVLLTVGFKIDKSKSQSAIRYFDGIFHKAFEEHLEVIKDFKYNIRRFEEVPNLDETLKSIVSTINEDTPDFLVESKKIENEFILPPAQGPEEKTGKSDNRKEKDVVEIESEQDETNPPTKKVKVNYLLPLLVSVSLLLSGIAVYIGYRNYVNLKKTNQIIKKKLSNYGGTANSKNTTPKLLRKVIRDNKEQYFFNHKAFKDSSILNTEIKTEDNFVNTVIKVSGISSRIASFDKNSIYQYNESDINKISTTLTQNESLTFFEAFSLLGETGLLLHQKE